ncbi:MAG: hypothetical protein ABIB47_06225 [Candidatus Woesearchaeota archaeon]
MFIRIKKIQNQEYAYLVKNIWRKRKKSSRQKVTKYLGKVHKTNKTKDVKLEEFLKIKNLQDYLKNTEHKKIIKDIIRLELFNHNFKEITKATWLYETQNIKINLRDKKVVNTKSKKLACLEINNNFLCGYTLSRLMDFNPKKGLTELQVGKQLANSFESAGILVPKEIFVLIAKKILNEIKK